MAPGAQYGATSVSPAGRMKGGDTEAVGSHISVHCVVLGQVVVNFFVFPDLFWVEYMDLPSELYQSAALTEGIHQ